MALRDPPGRLGKPAPGPAPWKGSVGLSACSVWLRGCASLDTERRPDPGLTICRIAQQVLRGIRWLCRGLGGFGPDALPRRIPAEAAPWKDRELSGRSGPDHCAPEVFEWSSSLVIIANTARRVTDGRGQIQETIDGITGSSRGA
jgi:hypothetical protein